MTARNRAVLAALAAGALLGTAPLAAQTPGTPPTSPGPAAGQPIAPPVEDSLSVSPRAALFRSLLLPGLGQAYVGAPGRGALYFALEAGSLWMVYRSSRGHRAALRREEFLRDSGALAENERFPLARARAQQVEDWITLSLFWALFAGADAYVAAQLSDFGDYVGVEPAADGSLRIRATLPGLGVR